MFLRVAMPIAQQQELRADEMAYRVVGARATISALVKLHMADQDIDIANPDEDSAARLFSTHPPLRDRVALASRLSGSPALPPDTRPSRALIEALLCRAASSRVRW